jgi:hypothetical protein
MTERKVETESLTKGVYYLKCAIEFVEDFKRSCLVQARGDAMVWVNKLNWVLNDIYSALTPESRERFKKEIAYGDVFYFPEMSQKLLQMTPAQREMMEMIAGEILKGEEIKIEKT